MSRMLTVHDPYRNIDTTLAEFAKAEGVPKYTVSHYYWWHKYLDGFRDRPAKGTGNGIKPHIYTKDGVFVSAGKAEKLIFGGYDAMKYWRERGIVDIDEINRRQRIKYENSKKKHMYEADDGRMYTIAEYAKAQGVPYGTIREWIRHHKGTLKGFTTRKGSRINPTLHPHLGLGMSKSVKEWAEYFGVSKDAIKKYLYTHAKRMDGYKSKRGRKKYTYKGKTMTYTAWAYELGIGFSTLKKYLQQHNNSLEGIEATMPYSRGGNRAKIIVERYGQRHSLREWALILNIPVIVLRNHWYRNHSLDGIEDLCQKHHDAA